MFETVPLKEKWLIKWMTLCRSADISTRGSISVRELLSASVDLAERGGREVVAVKKQHNENQQSKGETKEGANDPVTDGDYRSHVQIISGLRKAFPQLHVSSRLSNYLLFPTSQNLGRWTMYKTNKTILVELVPPSPDNWFRSFLSGQEETISERLSRRCAQRFKVCYGVS